MIADFSGRPSGFRESSNAFFAIAGKARRSSNAVLAAAELAGFATAVAVLWIAPHEWGFALPAVALGAAGLWGITDHFLAAQSRIARVKIRFMLRAFRFAVAAIGITAFIAAGYFMVGRLIGTVVS